MKKYEFNSLVNLLSKPCTGETHLPKKKMKIWQQNLLIDIL